MQERRQRQNNNKTIVLFLLYTARDCISSINMHCPAQRRRNMNRLAQAVAFTCLAWTTLYLLWGGTSSGKSFYASATKAILMVHDYKGGMPLLCSGIPLLLAGTVASALWLRVDSATTTTSITKGHRHVSFSGGLMRRFWHKCRYSCHNNAAPSGDATTPRWLSLSFLAVMTCSLLGLMNRKIGGGTLTEESTDYIVMEIGNIFGFVALIVTCFVLVPVTKYSPLTIVFGLSTPTALAVHQTMGRFIVLASLFHGLMHSYRWVALSGESYMTMIIPPRGCWSSSESSLPTCRNEDTDCSCYDIFKNLAGVVAGVGLLVIGLSSLAVVRRHMYGLFYRIHVIAAPLVFVATIVHWNRSMLYMAGGVLYYAAMYVTTYVEQRFGKPQQRKPQQHDGVALVSAERIVQPDTIESAGPLASFLSLTFQADTKTVLRFRPTQYVKLQVPEISSVSHPFSVNRVYSPSNGNGNDNQKLRLLIRENGKFTKTLAQKCCGAATTTTPPPPRLLMEGFFGTDTRFMDIQKHDVVVIIAGGIGITTYLTLLRDTVETVMRQQQQQQSRDGGGGDSLQEQEPQRRLQKIFLHWMCREEHLVDYVRKEYLDAIVTQPGVDSIHGIQVSITIHNTGPSNNNNNNSTTTSFKEQRPPFADVENRQKSLEEGEEEQDAAIDRATPGYPFQASRFSIGSAYSYVENLPAFLAFALVSIGGLEIIWYTYINIQDSEEFFSRFWVVGLLSLYCFLVGVVLNLAIYFWCSPTAAVSSAEFVPIRSDEGVEMEVMMNNDKNTTTCGPDIDDNVHPTVNPKHAGIISISAGGIQRRREMRTFSLEERLGRPSIHSLLNPLEDCKYPAVFSCGPVALMQDVKDKTIGRCHMRLQRWVCGEPRIALYEEAFEM